MNIIFPVHTEMELYSYLQYITHTTSCHQSLNAGFIRICGSNDRVLAGNGSDYYEGKSVVYLRQISGVLQATQTLASLQA